jgi:hypothetical protein
MDRSGDHFKRNKLDSERQVLDVFFYIWNSKKKKKKDRKVEHLVKRKGTNRCGGELRIIRQVIMFKVLCHNKAYFFEQL